MFDHRAIILLFSTNITNYYIHTAINLTNDNPGTRKKEFSEKKLTTFYGKSYVLRTLFTRKSFRIIFVADIIKAENFCRLAMLWYTCAWIIFINSIMFIFDSICSMKKQMLHLFITSKCTLYRTNSILVSVHLSKISPFNCCHPIRWTACSFWCHFSRIERNLELDMPQNLFHFEIKI